MRPAACLLPLLAAALAAPRPAPPPQSPGTQNITLLDEVTLLQLSNGTILLSEGNDTLAADGQDALVRKKRTFGDVVFRGLADVLGYRVVRGPQAVTFPPPLDPVPGIDTPLQAGPAPPPPPPCCAPPPPPPPPPPRCCAPPPTPPPPPPPPKKPADAIQSNFQLAFNFNRIPATPAPPAPPAPSADALDYEDEEAAPIVFEPRAARLPPEPPRVYQARRAPPADNQSDEDYLDDTTTQDDDYEEDVQESRGRAAAVRSLGTALDQFWDKNQRLNKKKAKQLRAEHYRDVHFGDRDAPPVRRSDASQSLQRQEEGEGEGEATTTTEDPRRPLRPRVLPPTEHNPDIDTVTVRVPPIYRQKRPKKYHRAPERPPPDRDDEDQSEERYDEDERDSSGEQSAPPPREAPPAPAPAAAARRKKTRRARSTEDGYSAGDYDYHGHRLPISAEEKQFMEYLKHFGSAEQADHEDIKEAPAADSDEQFLDDHERLKDEPEREGGEGERADEKERDASDDERADEGGRADERERSDRLSAGARVHEAGYSSRRLHATSVQVDAPAPHVASIKRKTVRIGSP